MKIAKTPTTSRLKESANQTGIEFLDIDLDIAITMSKIASEAKHGSEKRRRNTRNARRAYDVILHLRQKLQPAPEQDVTLDEKIQHLRQVLIDLGEQFGSK